MPRTSAFLQLGKTTQLAIIEAARDQQPIEGLTHNFYRYPARCSPTFVRAAIEAFTRPGDLVLDPHVGGGTALVEALALGRHSVGVDISQLAEFVSTVKATVLTEEELAKVAAWARQANEILDVRGPSYPIQAYAEAGYYKHLQSRSRWRLRKAIEQAIWLASRLREPKIEAFARCVVLRTAHWALNGRERLPTFHEFRAVLVKNASEMISGARDLGSIVFGRSDHVMVRVLNRSAAKLEIDPAVRFLSVPKLVITSPPYPGIHILYHRWQVDGRKEAPLPFMIANKLDGAASSYYTMGDRKYPQLKTYFDNIRATMSSAAALADKRTVFVQVVAFADPSWQLPRYIQTLREAGLDEVFLPALRGQLDGRLWRSVPGRRWYSSHRETPGSQEVVLIHRKRSSS